MKLLAAAFVLALPGLAYANSGGQGGTPVPVDRADEYARAGQCTNGRNVYVDSGYTRSVRTSTAASTAASNRQLLLPWGSLVTMSCDAAVIGAFTMDRATTITSTTGIITDSGTTRRDGETVGLGGAFKVLAATYRDQVPWRVEAAKDSGSLRSQRTKGCYHSSNATINKAIYGYPCDTTADCFYSGTTCDETVKPAGVFLMLKGAASDTACWVCPSER